MSNPVISIPGIKQIGRCNIGTLSTTPAGIALVGIRDKATMKFTSYKTSKDVKDRQSRNMLQAQLDYEMLQPTMKYLASLFAHMNLGCDVQIMSEKQSFTANSEDVFKFTSSTFLLGLGWEYIIKMDRRSVKESLKGAADYDTVKSLIDSGDSESAVSLNGTGNLAGEDETLRRPVKFLAIESPQATALFEPGELEDFNYSMKANTSENAYGQDCVDWISHKIEITIRNAAVTKLVELLGKDVNASVLIKLGNAGAYYDAFDFAAGAVNNYIEPDWEDKRIAKITFEGKVRPFEHEFTYGGTHGGIDADAGLNGGTLKIGY
jgi:hypothetical protein